LQQAFLIEPVVAVKVKGDDGFGEQSNAFTAYSS